MRFQAQLGSSRLRSLTPAKVRIVFTHVVYRIGICMCEANATNENLVSICLENLWHLVESCGEASQLETSPVLFSQNEIQILRSTAIQKRFLNCSGILWDALGANLSSRL